MAGPKRQHYIPKSYLKNFSVEKDGKYFVQAKLKSEDEPKDDLISIMDICIKKNIYTIPTSKGDKYALEKFYASNIDEIYPEVYQLLIDPNLTEITPKQRGQIVMTTMSLFFRTPKFLNAYEERLQTIMKYAVLNNMDVSGNVKFKFKEYDLNFNIKDLNTVTEELKIKSKLEFLYGHLKDWHDFVNFKINAGLMVFKIYEDMQLITSDNPVIIDYNKPNFQVFDPANTIILPLDNKHYLVIYPNDEETNSGSVWKGTADNVAALVKNSQTEENSDEWILGKPNSLTSHFSDQKKFNALTPENFKIIQNTKEKNADMYEIYNLMQSSNGFYRNEEFAAKIRELSKKEIHRNNPEIERYVIELTKNGFEM